MSAKKRLPKMGKHASGQAGATGSPGDRGRLALLLLMLGYALRHLRSELHCQEAQEKDE